MSKQIIPIERIAQAIRWIRSQKVLLDSDLAEPYGVTTGNLNKAVRRNVRRFPADFMFRLKAEEARNLRCQFGISSSGGRRALPYAFTEQGIAERHSREIGFHVRKDAARYRTRKRA